MTSQVSPDNGGDAAASAPNQTLDQTCSMMGDLVTRIIQELGDDVHDLVEHIGHLKEQMAGFRPDRTGDDARRRLQNPRLRTTYLDERIMALSSKSIDLRVQIAALLRPLIEPVLKLEVAEAELAVARARRSELQAKTDAKAATGLFPAVAVAADWLHEQYHVTHWHWGAAGPDELKLIAEILRRKTGLISKDEHKAAEDRRWK